VAAHGQHLAGRLSDSDCQATIYLLFLGNLQLAHPAKITNGTDLYYNWFCLFNFMQGEQQVLQKLLPEVFDWIQAVVEAVVAVEEVEGGAVGLGEAD
jgi:hypothetical protein